MDFEKMLREMIQQAVDDRINDAAAVEDRMVRSMAHMAETGKTRKQKYPDFAIIWR